MTREKETITRRTNNLIEMISLSPDEYQNLYRTKDIYLASYLLARGYDWFALEEVEHVKGPNNNRRGNTQTQKLIYFLFKDNDLMQKNSLNYFNTNKASLNVNAHAMISAYHSVRSVITDPPF